MIRAVKKVRERLLRATAALEQAGVPYAVIGGNAVAAWVARVDESAVRNTPDVDLLLRREDYETAAIALNAVGFIRTFCDGREVYLDGPKATARDVVHVVFATEKACRNDLVPAPDVADSEPSESFRILSLEPLVRMKLSTFRNKDCMHIRDLLDVGLLDATWCDRLPAELAARLQQLIDTPGG